MAQQMPGRYNWNNANAMEAFQEELQESYNFGEPQFMFNQSGVKMIPLQSKSKGFASITKGDNSDFSKMDSEHFVHALKREDPTDFKLADLEEVESIIVEDKPRTNKNPAMDSELVQFFGFVTKKLENNTKGLQKLQ